MKYSLAAIAILFSVSAMAQDTKHLRESLAIVEYNLRYVESVAANGATKHDRIIAGRDASSGETARASGSSSRVLKIPSKRHDFARR